MRINKTFLAQIGLLFAFVSLASSFVAYSKNKVIGYMYQIQAYASQISALQDAAMTPEGLQKLQSIVVTIKPIINKATYYTYITVPLILLVLWIALIGTCFYISKARRKSYKNYMLSFAAISPVPILLGLLIGSRALKLLSEVLSTGDGRFMFAVHILLLLYLGYLTLISYVLARTHSLKTLHKAVLKTMTKKSHMLAPLFLILSAVAVALVSVVLSTYLSLTSGAIRLSLAYNLVALLVILSAVTMLENYMSKIILESSRSHEETSQ